MKEITLKYFAQLEIPGLGLIEGLRRIPELFDDYYAPVILSLKAKAFPENDLTNLVNARKYKFSLRSVSPSGFTVCDNPQPTGFIGRYELTDIEL